MLTPLRFEGFGAAILNPLRLDIATLDTLPTQLSLDYVREHCHVDASSPPTTLENALLTTYIRAGIEWFEGATHRTTFMRAHTWVLGEFPYWNDGRIALPRGRTVSVESMGYSSGNQVYTLTGPSASPPGTGFQQDLRGNDGGVVMPPYNSLWPATDFAVPAPVVIHFTAGWPDGEVPGDIINAILFFVSDAFEIRSASDVQRYDVTYQTLREHMASSYYLHQW
jgi:hypothetical protein